MSNSFVLYLSNLPADEVNAVEHRTATFDANSRRVTVAGRTTVLQDKSWQVLALLREQAPETVSRADIIDAVWQGNSFVGEKGLNQAIWAIRSALADDSRRPAYIRTMPRLGYKWIGNETPARMVGANKTSWFAGTLAAGLMALLALLVQVPQSPSFGSPGLVATKAYRVDRDIHVVFANGQLGILKNQNRANIGEPVLSKDGTEIAVTVIEAGGCRMVTLDLSSGERQDFNVCPPGVT